MNETDETEYHDRVDIIHDVSNYERVEVHYESVTTGTDMTVRGIVKDAELSERTVIDDADHTVAKFHIIGEGHSDHEPGEVIKIDGDSRRRVGWFSHAYRAKTRTDQEETNERR